MLFDRKYASMLFPRKYTLKERNQGVMEAIIMTLDSISMASKERELSGPEIIALMDAMIEDAQEKLRRVDADLPVTND